MVYRFDDDSEMSFAKGVLLKQLWHEDIIWFTKIKIPAMIIMRGFSILFLISCRGLLVSFVKLFVFVLVLLKKCQAQYLEK